jgi:ferredoxin
MIAAARNSGANWRLFYGGRTATSMAFTDQFHGSEDKVEFYPEDERGFMPLGELLSSLEPGTLVYCCGPEPMLKAVEANSGTLAPGALQFERFSPKVIEHDPDTAFEVELSASGVVLEVPADSTIMEVLREKTDVMVFSSCEEGMCGTCETRILAGVADHRDSVLSDIEQKEGDRMMICVSRSKTPRLTLDL